LKIISIYNIKGGVGKTAAAVNMAYMSAGDGFKTLLFDLDPQGSASYYFRVKAPKKASPEKLLKGGRKLEKKIRGSDFHNLDILPSHISYRNLDLTLDSKKRSKERINEILRPFEKDYDIIFIDCPPNVTLLSENIFLASDKIVIPVIPTTLSVISYRKLMDFFVDSGLDISKILAFFSMTEKRKKLHKEIIEKMPEKESGFFFKSHIPYSSHMEKMGVYRKPLLEFMPDSPAAKSCRNLWDELKTLVLNQT